MTIPTLNIIIINWNSGTQLRECLEAVAASDRQGYQFERITIVDNASTDLSLAGLADLPLPLKIIQNSQNLGFGAACNQGAADSRADYLLFLNPDTRVERDALAGAIEFMGKPQHSQVGVVGAKLVDERGHIQRCCARFPTPLNIWCSVLGIDKLVKRPWASYMMSEWDHNSSQSVDHLMGAFYLIRNQIFQSLGGFDPAFFVYFEDLDLSRRLASAGWDLYYLSEIRTFHKGGGTSEGVKATRLFYALRSRILYGYKHFDVFNATAVAIATLSIEFVTRIGFAILQRSSRQCLETIGGYRQLFANLGSIYRSIGS